MHCNLLQTGVRFLYTWKFFIFIEQKHFFVENLNTIDQHVQKHAYDLEERLF